MAYSFFQRIPIDISKNVPAHWPPPCAYGSIFKKLAAMFFGRKPKPHCNTQFRCKVTFEIWMDFWRFSAFWEKSLETKKKKGLAKPFSKWFSSWIDGLVYWWNVIKFEKYDQKGRTSMYIPSDTD
jgi:hypothetical protein